MPESSVAEFEKNLRMSGAVSDNQLSKIDFTEFSDPRYLAKRLVDQQVLTEWQAKLVLSGRNQMKVGGYLLLDRVERNELGDRYQAKHQSLDRLVELQFLPKEFNRQSPQFEPFIKSARMMTEIDHPNLAHVYDVGEEGSRYYVVQEFVNGEPLSAFDFAAMAPADVIRLIKELASVVRFLHERKILHGSINKDTVFINRGGQCQLNGLITKILQERVLGRHDEFAAKQEALQFGLIDRVAMQSLAGELLEKALGRDADPELLANIVQLGNKPDSLEKI
ncbi:MAG: protein kinase, partial [Pirellulaceae bacterium]